MVRFGDGASMNHIAFYNFSYKAPDGKPSNNKAFSHRNPPATSHLLKRDLMPTSELTHVTSATAVARSVETDPTTPVVVHWQVHEFPIRLALKLVKREHGILWIVATENRRRIAVAELQAAGIRVNTAESAEMPQEPLTEIQKLRRQLKKKGAIPTPIQHPGRGTVTVVLIQSIWHHAHLDVFLGGAAPLAVFDHVGSLNVQAAQAELTDEEGGVVVTAARAENIHPIPVLRGRIPMVFLCRDEFEIALLRADFARSSTPISHFSTRWQPDSRLTVSVVGTDLATSGYAVGAFLSIVACNNDVQLVGEALIGALTPDKLSMSTTAPLTKGVLKLSQQQKTLADVAAKQADVSLAELHEMRVRDHIRTTVLALDPSCRTPELVILCPGNMVRLVSDTVPVAFTDRLPNATIRMGAGERPALNQLGNRVVAAAWAFPSKLNHGSRLNRIAGAIEAANPKSLPKRIVRLANALHRATGVRHSELDLSDHPELFAGKSDKADTVLAVFNKVLNLAYPWSPETPKENDANRELRLEVRRRYKEYWRKRSAPISVATSEMPASSIMARGVIESS